MSRSPLDRYRDALAGFAAASRLRALAPAVGVDFTSNDYLGLAGSDRLARAAAAALERGVPVGAAASRLLRGNHAEIESLEARAAGFFGAEAALYFGGGYVANTALLATLPDRGDLIVHDALIHASAHDGMRLGRAERAAAAHNDPQAFEDALAAWRRAGGRGQAWIAVESLYSMDGDQAPLSDLMALADRFDAFLLIDEAHATGVFGPDGRGLAADYEGRDNVIALHTCGKALGAHGALVCAPTVIRDYLVNRCRPFIYATAPSPLMAAVVNEALDILRDEPARRRRLHELAAFTGQALRDRCRAGDSGSQIKPVVVGDDARAMAAATFMRERGWDIRGIRPPTVPEGTARLRIAVSLHVNEREIAAMADDLARILDRTAPC